MAELDAIEDELKSCGIADADRAFNLTWHDIFPGEGPFLLHLAFPGIDWHNCKGGDMYEFLKGEEFLGARKNKRHYLFRGVLPNTPSWDDVFSDLEKSLEEQSLIKAGPYCSYVTHNGDKHIRLAAEFLDEIRKLDASLSGSAHVYIGLTRFSESFGKHRDDADVFFWQIIGSTRWKVFTQAGVKEYTLSVGDVLYVPRHMDHEVVSLCPRVGISFGLDYPSAKKAS